jgi:hypothetical protein
MWHYEDPSGICAITMLVLSFWLRISTSSHFQIILFLGIQQRHSVKVLLSPRKETKMRDHQEEANQQKR